MFTCVWHIHQRYPCCLSRSSKCSRQMLGHFFPRSKSTRINWKFYCILRNLLNVKEFIAFLEKFLNFQDFNEFQRFYIKFGMNSLSLKTCLELQWLKWIKTETKTKIPKCTHKWKKLRFVELCKNHSENQKFLQYLCVRFDISTDFYAVQCIAILCEQRYNWSDHLLACNSWLLDHVQLKYIQLNQNEIGTDFTFVCMPVGICTGVWVRTKKSILQILILFLAHRETTDLWTNIEIKKRAEKKEQRQHGNNVLTGKMREREKCSENYPKRDKRWLTESAIKQQYTHLCLAIYRK